MRQIRCRCLESNEHEVIGIYPATVDWCNLVLETLASLDQFTQPRATTIH
ncbi:hypothetical protein H6F88_00545 [Oculatella sp. FACHB-28]|nr:hypothetical protein [Oculatella sp. FACHB-28]MBD2054535.1 hypothetical protein [Oculatella sp. FACHB-28]